MSGKSALLDSNIFVYISQKLLSFDNLFRTHENFCSSIISYMEVLGYNFENEFEREIVQILFQEMEVVNIDDAIVSKVIEIRKKRKIKLPDAIVYATASVRNLDLITRNVSDFKNIDRTVKVINPFNN